MSTDRPLMTIQEMIEAAFGDPDKNVVNFKYIEAVLTIVSKQLNILNRRVSIPDPRIAVTKDKTRLSVSEVKIRASVPKKSKTKSLSGGSKSDHKSSGETHDTSSHDSSTSKSSVKDAATSSLRSSSCTSPHERPAKMSRKSSVSQVFQSKKYYEGLLDKIEEQREKVLRVIHQRVDSHEEGVVTPSPMASLPSTEMEYEKLLLVERVTPEEAEKALKTGQPRPVQLSIVTQEEFHKLANAVADLQTLFTRQQTEELPENVQLELRKQASLTDAASALQMAARLDSTEKAIKSMMDMLTELSKRPVPKRATDIEDSKCLEELLKQMEQQGQAQLVKEFSESGVDKKSDDSVGMSDIVFGVTQTKTGTVTYEQFNYSLQKLHDDISNTFGSVIKRAQSNAMNAMKIAKKAGRTNSKINCTGNPALTFSHKVSEGDFYIENMCLYGSYNDFDEISHKEKIDQALTLEDELRSLQKAMHHYAEQVNVLDAGISSQLANYQEQLTQMEYDLETGLENMQDALAVRGSDTEAMSELHAHFTNLQVEFDNTKTTQKDLEETQTEMSLDISKLRRDVEILRDIKSDRDEVEDALRDKAGLKDLNGMVDRNFFGAVIGDFEKRVRDVFKKIYGQEVVWQKLIDDFTNQLRKKADWIHLVSLRDDINEHLEMLRKRIHFMADILGEPNAAAVARRLQRDSACISCAAPAVMNAETKSLPALPALRPTPPGAEETQAKRGGGGDHYTCYCGLPIPHQKKDFRSEVCKRYCGGDHTKVSYVHRAQAPPELQVKSMQREVGLTVGSDGKSYYVDQPISLKPCIPCNPVKPSLCASVVREPKVASEASKKATEPSRINDTSTILLASAWNSREQSILLVEALEPVEPDPLLTMIGSRNSTVLESLTNMQALGPSTVPDVDGILNVGDQAVSARDPVDFGISSKEINQPLTQLAPDDSPNYDDQHTFDSNGIKDDDQRPLMLSPTDAEVSPKDIDQQIQLEATDLKVSSKIIDQPEAGIDTPAPDYQ